MCGARCRHKGGWQRNRGYWIRGAVYVR
jgi:hypothetical protein